MQIYKKINVWTLHDIGYIDQVSCLLNLQEAVLRASTSDNTVCCHHTCNYLFTNCPLNMSLSTIGTSFLKNDVLRYKTVPTDIQTDLLIFCKIGQLKFKYCWPLKVAECTKVQI